MRPVGEADTTTPAVHIATNPDSLPAAPDRAGPSTLTSTRTKPPRDNVDIGQRGRRCVGEPARTPPPGGSPARPPLTFRPPRPTGPVHRRWPVHAQNRPATTLTLVS